MRGRQVAVVGVVVAALAASCATTEQGDAGSVNGSAAGDEEPPHPGPVAPEDGPFDADAEFRPDLMEIRPGEASPGDHVELHFPQETSRGVGFVLEERVGDGWEVSYFLTVSDHDREDPNDPGGSWLPPDNPDRDEWPDIGVEGSGPNFALIPEPAAPGEYRICTAMQRDSFCAELTITG